MTDTHRFTATCAKGFEGLLAEELRSFGVSDVRETAAAVTFSGPLTLGYRVCLWSRLASRVLLLLADFPCSTAEDLYEGAHAVRWEDHISPSGTIAVDANGTTTGLTHTGFSAQKLKDAVVDRLRDIAGKRPSVDLERPDVRLNLRLYREAATISLNLSGEPLHKRGYRTAGEQVQAPLKESLAAAILLRAGWPQIAQQGGSLLDPMCGSGTLLIEGALMATDRAPGILRDRWGFTGWLGHDKAAWDALLDEADERAEAGDAALPLVAGSDSDPAAIELARGCIKRAGFGERISVEVASLAQLKRPAGARAGLLVTNPPYGVRLGQAEHLAPLYETLGERLLAEFDGWQAGVFTAEPDLARATGLRSHKSYSLFNGAVPTKLYLFDVAPERVWRKTSEDAWQQP